MRFALLLFYLLAGSCLGNNSRDDRYFSLIKENNIPLPPVIKGDWLYEHEEKVQSLAQYKAWCKTPQPTGRRVLYLMPIGNFSPVQQKTLELTRQYLEIFYQSETILLPAISDGIVPAAQRRTGKAGNEQLLATYIVDSVLNTQLPTDGMALMAITATDLYPSPNWNYVFGLGSYGEHVGVTSIYRLQNKDVDSANFLLRRLINVSSHEIGHMLSLKHCTYSRCVMNGSNSLQETDRSPNRLCSNCAQKLSWRLGYDDEKRTKELVNFFKKNKLLRDYTLLQKDNAVIQNRN